MKRENHNTIDIRRATVADAPEIADLLYYSFAEYQALYTAEAFAATTPGIEEIGNRINKSFVWVAIHEGVIAGTVTVITNGSRALFRSLAVSPSARKKGIGKEIMKHAEKVAADSGVVSLELTTTPFLVEAIRLYKLCGFEETGYDDLLGTPLIKMKKWLQREPASIRNHTVASRLQ